MDVGAQEKTAGEIRELVGQADPDLLAFLDECRRVFGARLVAISVPGYSKGNPFADKYTGVQVSPPVKKVRDVVAAAKREALEAGAGDYRGADFERRMGRR